MADFASTLEQLLARQADVSCRYINRQHEDDTQGIESNDFHQENTIALEIKIGSLQIRPALPRGAPRDWLRLDRKPFGDAQFELALECAYQSTKYATAKLKKEDEKLKETADKLKEKHEKHRADHDALSVTVDRHTT